MWGVEAGIQLRGETLDCRGQWRLPAVASVESELEALRLSGHAALTLRTRDVDSLDLAGARLLQRLIERAEAAGVPIQLDAGDAHRRLIHLASQVHRPQTRSTRRDGLLSVIGQRSIEHVQEFRGFLAFVGEAASELLPRLLRPWTFRGRRLVNELEQAGLYAVPIVALLSFLVGMVIAYQLRSGLETYGATLFLPELLTSTILRELGPLIVAIVVAGRTASSFAAQLGTMKINEEIDALRTLGISPFDMMVLPKLLALLIALPLLTVLSGLAGILGGVLVTWMTYDQGLVEFFNRLPQGMGVRHLWLGLAKAPVFAAVIAIIGCRQGLRVQRGAEGVGRATTTAVVQAIFAVIVINAAFSILFNILGL
ncbi:MlaE family ABC transporter permease [Natronospira bacteriovora]|uniref:ABC transporter permease n=1 Tax=Natronospira bacteriovora TaxID=3069753 RepID=A0ABU0WAR5_9GAMM|nr:ABC transporter permease [Natronospira sp. AB-CW4]MDQ2070035.1 ABC transporter permease [Natronospira sp. AB-CW4]